MLTLIGESTLPEINKYFIGHTNYLEVSRQYITEIYTKMQFYNFICKIILNFILTDIYIYLQQEEV